MNKVDSLWITHHYLSMHANYDILKYENSEILRCTANKEVVSLIYPYITHCQPWVSCEGELEQRKDCK